MIDLAVDGQAALLAQVVDFLAAEGVLVLFVVLGGHFPGEVEPILRQTNPTFWMLSLIWLSTSNKCLTLPAFSIRIKEP
jgi:hypothetical protein